MPAGVTGTNDGPQVCKPILHRIGSERKKIHTQVPSVDAAYRNSGYSLLCRIGRLPALWLLCALLNSIIKNAAANSQVRAVIQFKHPSGLRAAVAVGQGKFARIG